MTSKQKVILIATQYVAKAREMTRQGDMLARVADILDEDGAREVFDTLLQMGLVDGDGLLVDGAEFDGQMMAKVGANN